MGAILRDEATSPRFSLVEIAAATKGVLRGAPQDLVVEGVSTDSRALPPGALFVALRGERFDGHAFLEQARQRGATAALVAADAELSEASLPLVVVADTLEALGALARLHRERFPELPVAAITGSNGKTTTKELAAAALEEAFGSVLRTQGNLNNEIGVPLTLFGLGPDHRAAVIEMGMNQPGEIGRLTAIARPTAGLVTCVHAVHLAGLGTLEGVAKAKGELFHGLGPEATAVANFDDPLVLAEARASGRPLLTFGGPGADVALLRILSHDADGLAFELSIHGGPARQLRLPLVGLHNAGNACAALALGLALGGDEDRLLAGLEKAEGFARRLERKAAPGGITVLDDCYNANPTSTLAALSTAGEIAGGRILAVLGDLRELGDEEERGHRQVGEAAAKLGVAGLVAFGPLARGIASSAEAAGLPAESILHTESPEEAVDWLRARMRPGDLILCKGSRGVRLERVVDPLVEGEAL